MTLFENARTIAVWADTVSEPVPCKDPTCSAKLIWAVVVKSGAKMCFTSPAEPLRFDHQISIENPNGRQIAVYDFADNHWATCPGARSFKRGKQ